MQLHRADTVGLRPALVPPPTATQVLRLFLNTTAAQLPGQSLIDSQSAWFHLSQINEPKLSSTAFKALPPWRWTRPIAGSATPWHRAFLNGVELDFSRPGKPMENALIESFNGGSGRNARTRTGSYPSKMPTIKRNSGETTTNDKRRHSALDNLSPREFAVPAEIWDSPARQALWLVLKLGQCHLPRILTLIPGGFPAAGLCPEPGGNILLLSEEAA